MNLGYVGYELEQLADLLWMMYRKVQEQNGITHFDPERQYSLTMDGSFWISLARKAHKIYRLREVRFWRQVRR